MLRTVTLKKKKKADLESPFEVMLYFMMPIDGSILRGCSVESVGHPLPLAVYVMDQKILAVIGQ